MVFDNDHKTQLSSGAIMAGSFEKPCMFGLEETDSSSESGKLRGQQRSHAPTIGSQAQKATDDTCPAGTEASAGTPSADDGE